MRITQTAPSEHPDSEKKATRISKCSAICISLVVLILYAGVACITTWPLAAHITTHVPGNSSDSLLHYWNGWWVQRAFASGQSPFYTPYLFYPIGANLVTHNMAWFNILSWLLLEPLLSGIPAYNMIVLASLTLCGYTAFVLANKLTANPYAAFVAGLIYQAWPFRLSQLDHPNMLSTQWEPLFFLFLIYTIQKGRWRDSLLTGLFFVFIGYTRWQLLIPTTLMALICFICMAPHWLAKDRRFVLSRLFLAGGIACMGLLPPFSLLFSQLKNDKIASTDLLYAVDESRMQTDVLAYITPGGSHPLFREQTQPLYSRYYGDRVPNRRFPAYVGLVALILALFGIRFKKWQSLAWVLMAMALISLALGPCLRLNGKFYSQIPTLYRLLSPLFFVRLIREPDRFNMFLALPISVLAAYGAAGLLTSKPKWTRWLLTGLFSAVALFEYLIIPVSLYYLPSDTTSFYAQMAQEPGEFAVLDLPLSVEAKGYMFDQTLHHRPIVEGNISRRYEELYSYINNNSWLRTLRDSHEMTPALSDVSRQLSVLAGDGIRYIIMHPTLIGADRIAHWQRYLLTKPVYQDKRVIVYAVSPQAGRDFTLRQELIPGLGPVDVLASADCLAPDRMFEVNIGWGSTRAVERDIDVAISLVDSTGIVQQTEQFPISTVWPTSQWPANALAWGYYPLRLSASIPAGKYDVTLTLLDTDTGRASSQPMLVRSVTVQSDICNLATVSKAQDVNTIFGDQIRLAEYQVRQEGEWLNLTLYWRLETRMDKDYKVFVHVFDPATGVPAAQDDAMPHHGAYPTTFWWPGEVVEDPISIPLRDVHAGSYGIAIGLYDPATRERLPLVNNAGELNADGRLILAEVVQVD